MNYNNILYSLSLSILLISMPLLGMEIVTTAGKIASSMYTFTVDYFGKSTLSNQQKEKAQIEIDKTLYPLIHTANNFKKITLKSNKEKFLQNKIDLTKQCSAFIKSLTEYDQSLLNTESSRIKLLLDKSKFLNNDTITENDINIFIKTAEAVKKTTIYRIENPKKSSLENSSITLAQELNQNSNTTNSISYNSNESIFHNSFPTNVSDQIEYINAMTISDDFKIYILRILWLLNKSNFDSRRIIDAALNKKNAKLPFFTYKNNERPLLIITENIDLNNCDINNYPNLDNNFKNFIDNQKTELNKIQKQEEEKFSQSQKQYENYLIKAVTTKYKKIEKLINNTKQNKEKNITLKDLKTYKKIVEQYSIFLSNDKIIQYEVSILKEKDEEQNSNLLKKINQLIAKKELEKQLHPLSLKIKNQIKNQTVTLDDLIKYKNILTSYIDILQNGKFKTAQMEILNILEQKIITKQKTQKIEAERIEAERIEAERIEAERIETERIEAERIETERIEAERIETERIEATQQNQKSNFSKLKNIKIPDNNQLSQNDQKNDQANLLPNNQEDNSLNANLQQIRTTTTVQEQNNHHTDTNKLSDLTIDLALKKQATLNQEIIKNNHLEINQKLENLKQQSSIKETNTTSRKIAPSLFYPILLGGITIASLATLIVAFMHNSQLLQSFFNFA